ncbi:MAG: FAD-dependent thymidylate synthase [Bryobacteraceae bacterium]
MDLTRPSDVHADIVATLLYTSTNRPYRGLYDMVTAWSSARRNEVIDVAMRLRSRRNELLRHFRGGPYVFDIVMDIGAYRDLHRHRRCYQFRQDYSSGLGYATPPLIHQAGLTVAYDQAMNVNRDLPPPGSDYLLPFATKGRFLFKMDFAEAEYISRLRSGVKGHQSYREVAWNIKIAMEKLEPELGKWMQATLPG